MIEMKNVLENGSLWPVTYDLTTCIHKKTRLILKLSDKFHTVTKL